MKLLLELHHTAATVKVEQTDTGLYKVSYGCQSKAKLSHEDAALILGTCLMDAITRPDAIDDAPTVPDKADDQPTLH